jgi:hypothetical protein
MGDIEAEVSYNGNTYDQAYENCQKSIKLTRNLKQKATN